jgi:hypothetical protein
MKKIYYLLLIILVIGCSKNMDVKVQPEQQNNKGSILLLSVDLERQVDTLSISKVYRPKVVATYSNGYKTDITDSVTITSSDNTVFLSNKTYYGSKSGTATFSITYNGYSFKDTVYVSEIEYVDVNTFSFLTTPSNPSAKIIVPVVVVNYYPTLNGVDLDTKRAPSLSSTTPMTLNAIKDKTIQFLNLTKFGLEEGSKFRGYNNITQSSSVSFKIVKYINVYEIKKGMMDKIGGVVYQPEYNELFTKLNLKQLVENEGVKEVWFSLRPISNEYPVVKNENIGPENFINLPESNMSSPTGDVSNSVRYQNDLPVYNKTYVVYGYNLETSSANMIHNRGHQIEAQLSNLDQNFWGSYSNTSDGYADSTHIGCTHKPPNTTKDYDWNNKTFAYSDIEDWKPTGGTKKLINSDRWMNINYTPPTPVNLIPYEPNDPQMKWLIFWLQSIPSNNSNITNVNDWWDLFYNWDDAIKNRKKLTN